MFYGVIYLPSATLIEPKHKGGDGETEKAEGAGVCKLLEWRVGNLRDGVEAWICQCAIWRAIWRDPLSLVDARVVSHIGGCNG